MTPINVQALQVLLRQSGYDRGKIEFLIRGFQEGFSIGCEGPRNRCDQSENIPLRVGNTTVLWNNSYERSKTEEICGARTLSLLTNSTYSPQ